MVAVPIITIIIIMVGIGAAQAACAAMLQYKGMHLKRIFLIALIFLSFGAQRAEAFSSNCTGGTIISSGGYTIHTFTTGGTFTCTSAGTVDYLVVAGGGGGASSGGGGGAGGMLTGSLSVTATSYSITVGGGGAGGVSGGNHIGVAGSNSVFSTITATGGGSGGSNTCPTACSGGGSGGGSGADTSALHLGGTGVAGQGNNGGSNGGANASPSPSGGGGGAGAVGANGVGNTVSGAGGAGLSSSISGSAVTYAGGGGGASYFGGGTAGAGGSGGGGAGNDTNGTGTAGTSNTGGGGGGGTSTGIGGAGGSGIVIIRYVTPKVFAPTYSKYKFAGGYTKFKGGVTKFNQTIRTPLSCTGGTITYRGGYKVHTFFNNGSLTCSTIGSVDYLVVAGGGGGGGNQDGGGGGAGGMLTGSTAVSAQTYSITVGGGGTGGTAAMGTNGGNSIFSTFTAVGGGYGGNYAGPSALGVAGGSGGGNAGSNGAAGGSGTVGQGNAGGAGIGTGSPYTGGGGGGAGAVGASGTAGGIGGIGVSSSISGSATYYAGGGGAGRLGTSIAGGLGGGGAGGGTGVAGSAGTANTGGGGGAAGDAATNGGAGGSGIVIISYPIASSPSYATWNPSDKGATTALSNGNLTTTQSGSNSTRATIGKSSGKWYWETTITSGVDATFGIGNISASTATYVGGDVNGYGFYQYNGNKLNNGSAAYGASSTAGDKIGMALDMDNGTLGFYKNNVYQGTAYTGLSVTFYPMIGSAASAGVVDVTNFGATALTYPPPNGTFMNPKDISTNNATRNNNMEMYVVTSGGQWQSGRANTGFASGKLYFEVAGGTTPNVIGVGTSAALMTTYVGAGTTSWGYDSSTGNKYTNASGVAYGATYTSGDVIGVAVDIGAGTLIFYKNGVSQGQAFSGLTGTLYPIISLINSNTSMVANFGVTPFAYTPPAGYSAWDSTTYAAGVY